MIELRTKHSTEVPLLLSAPLCGEVGCKEVVEDVALYTIVLNLTLVVVCRTYLSDSSIVCGIYIKTSLLTDNEVVTFLVPVEVRTILYVSITKHTVGVLTILIIVCPPVWVVE